MLSDLVCSKIGAMPKVDNALPNPKISQVLTVEYGKCGLGGSYADLI